MLVLDTNVLLYDTECLDKMGENKVILPSSVIDELDELKDDFRNPELAQASREITRKIMELLENSKEKDLRKGIFYTNSKGETTELCVFDEKNSWKTLNECEKTQISSIDDWIIFSALTLNATLITRDNNMYLKASGVCNVELYYADDIREKSGYKGYRFLEVDANVFTSFIKDSYILNKPEFFEENTPLYPNEFLILTLDTNPKSRLFGICKGDRIKRIDLDKVAYSGMKMPPKGLSQKLAMYLLQDPDVDAISLLGVSGTGKTSLSVDYALNEVNKQNFNQMYYSKSLKGLADDEDYGTVPGEVDEKMKSVIVPLSCTLEMLNSITKESHKIKDPNKKVINGEVLVSMYQEQGILRILPLNYLRGMTLSNKIVILDEGQNLTKSKMKTLVTRISSNSKLIITGDENQIDDKNLNKYNNGLAHFIEQGKHESFIAHLTLDLDTESKRGRLSTFGNSL